MNILVLAGGTSSERSVSLKSARAVSEALQRRGHTVQALDTANGLALIGSDGKFIAESDTATGEIETMPESMVVSRSLESEEYSNTDLVFIVLHGGSGEDGTIQSMLDLAGIKYTGSGMLASALAMNKAMTKKLAKLENIATPKWMVFEKGKMRAEKNPIDKIFAEFTLPFIVKPNNSGSTVGLTLVKNMNQVESAIQDAFKEGVQVMIEQYVKGREITCSVLNGEPLPLVEIKPKKEIYDYECKYTKGMSEYICPAEINDEPARIITENAARMYEQIGCRGLARVDFILDNENKPWFLEVNTIPGMTELSLSPMAARAAGIEFDELIERICRTSIEDENDT